MTALSCIPVAMHPLVIHWKTRTLTARYASLASAFLVALAFTTPWPSARPLPSPRPSRGPFAPVGGPFPSRFGIWITSLYESAY